VTAVGALPGAKPVEQFELRLGDDALLLSHRLAQQLGHAPDLEAEAALAGICDDLLGQSGLLLAAAGQSTAHGWDELAYGRTDREYRNALLVELPNGGFAHTVIRLLFYSAYQSLLYRALARSSADADLAAFAGKAVHEAEYHHDYAAGWTLRLGDGTEEEHDRAAAAIAQLWPYTAELFAVDELMETLVAQGVVAEPGALQALWTESVADQLAEATLGPAPSSAACRPGGGRSGMHTEALGHLLAEMQSAHRALPGAVR
jgi:ring-1,2-phenylacetyl-CoA epoxidase subunit PaaC